MPPHIAALEMDAALQLWFAIEELAKYDIEKAQHRAISAWGCLQGFNLDRLCEVLQIEHYAPGKYRPLKGGNWEMDNSPFPSDVTTPEGNTPCSAGNAEIGGTTDE